MTRPINGAYCPMGCGQTLHLSDAGTIECGSLDCPDRSKAQAVLMDPETDHIIQCNDQGFTTLHPLRERGDELFGCTYHRDLGDVMEGPPDGVEGRYRVRRVKREHDPTSESFRSPSIDDYIFERIA